jgi:hypothetical protein
LAAKQCETYTNKEKDQEDLKRNFNRNMPAFAEKVEHACAAKPIPLVELTQQIWALPTGPLVR